jgi:hypothetical protein
LNIFKRNAPPATSKSKTIKILTILGIFFLGDGRTGGLFGFSGVTGDFGNMFGVTGDGDVVSDGETAVGTSVGEETEGFGFGSDIFSIVFFKLILFYTFLTRSTCIR